MIRQTISVSKLYTVSNPRKVKGRSTTMNTWGIGMQRKKNGRFSLSRLKDEYGRQREAGSGRVRSLKRAYGSVKGNLPSRHNNPRKARGNSTTLRNMASVTIQKLPNGVVKITGRKMAGKCRRNPNVRISTVSINHQPATLKTWRTLNADGYKASVVRGGRILCVETESYDTRAEAAEVAKRRARRR